ncbi:hypothetical protein [Streptomyces termitum]|uniref:hypothetical protein n=1 Tax=Streptomyces termitum TaxID=67368 RepID=UPI0037BBF813
MDTPLARTTTAEGHHVDTTLRTCRPARTAPADRAPEDTGAADPERHIVRGED